MPRRVPGSLVTCALVALAACAREAPQAPQEPWKRPLEQRAGDAFPRRYRSPDGVVVTIPKEPQRIVSATVLTDSVLLGICPPERLRALHALSKDRRWSPVAAESARFPRHHGGRVEEILDLEPDLVFIASFSQATTVALYGRSGAPIVKIDDFDTFADIEGNLRMIGWVVGRDAEAEKLVSEMERRLAVLAAGRERRAAWRLLLWAAGTTAGAGTLFDAMLGAVGATNAARHLSGHKSLKSEAALALEPDALVVGCIPGEEGKQLELLLQDPALQALRCVAKQKIVWVDSALLLATSHHAVLAAERIAERLDAWGRP